MRNVFRVLLRDLLRLVKAPAALVVVCVLITLPSLYTWFNVIGFWNPYGNTGNLRVMVVNEDVGTHDETLGDLDLGSQVISSIEGNTQLGWAVSDYDSAMAEVESGKAYAAFVIPKDFSSDVATIVSGDFQQPQLEYYVNEKLGPVSTKVTDTGATTLDQTINATFVSTVSGTVADMLDAKIAEGKNKVGEANARVDAQFDKAESAVSEARESIVGLSDATDHALGKVSDAQGSLSTVKTDIALMGGQLQTVSDLTLATQRDLSSFALSISPVLDEGSLNASQAAAQANASIGNISGKVIEAQGSVQGALAAGQAAVDGNVAAADQLRGLWESLPDGTAGKDALGDLLATIDTQNGQAQQSIDDLTALSNSTAGAASSIAGVSGSVNDAVQTTLSSANDYRGTLSSSTLPTLFNGLSQLGGTASGLSGAVSNQALLVDQTLAVLDQLSGTLSTTKDALGQTDGLLSSLQSSVGTVRTDLSALTTSGALAEFLNGTSVDPSKIAEFMMSPTQVDAENLYPLNAYGSAMAPLFTNLTLWIGAFMLLVILRQEVDDEGVEGLTLGQRYIARYLFFGLLVALQAAICVTGNLVIGVESASPHLYYLTAIVASLTYLSIQYALAVSLQHIGKGICIMLVFVQIPGATGLYPIEMTQPFFQAIYPFFPFTYGINAMRETIAGFYGGQWGHLMGALGLFLVASFVIGLVMRPYLSNLNRMVAREIKQSDILNGEEVQAPERRFRLGQLVRALSDREAYRERLHASARRFLLWYPRLKRGALFVGIVIPIVFTAVLSLTEGEKVVVLTCWLVWLVAISVFLLLLEHARDSLERQIALENIDDDELRSLFSERNVVGGMPAVAGARAVPAHAAAGASADVVAPAPFDPGCAAGSVKPQGGFVSGRDRSARPARSVRGGKRSRHVSVPQVPVIPSDQGDDSAATPLAGHEHVSIPNGQRLSRVVPMVEHTEEHDALRSQDHENSDSSISGRPVRPSVTSVSAEVTAPIRPEASDSAHLVETAAIRPETIKPARPEVTAPIHPVNSDARPTVYVGDGAYPSPSFGPKPRPVHGNGFSASSRTIGRDEPEVEAPASPESESTDGSKAKKAKHRKHRGGDDHGRRQSKEKGGNR